MAVSPSNKASKWEGMGVYQKILSRTWAQVAGERWQTSQPVKCSSDVGWHTCMCRDVRHQLQLRGLRDYVLFVIPRLQASH